MYAELERKICLQCKERKSLELFRCRIKQSKYKCYESYCKACEKTNYKNWYHNNKPKLKHRDFERNCEKFGLTAIEYKKMVEKQNNKCAICKKPETNRRDGVIKNLAIDHCHKTGRIRALLCNCCNTAVGLLREDIKTVKAVLKYLNKFKK